MNKKKDDFDSSDLLDMISGSLDQESVKQKANYRYVILFFFVIVATLATFLLFRYIEYKIPDLKPPTKSNNPLLLMDNKHEDSLTIPGVKVYDVESDIDDIDKDRLQREKEFSKARANAPESDSNMIIKRDQFASKKLYLLKKIEDSKTKEERLKYIKALEVELGDRK